MEHRIWFNTPTERWEEGLPIGNGLLAAMVLGRSPIDRIALNHEGLYRGANRDRTIEPRHHNLAEIRRLFFENEPIEAGTLASDSLSHPLDADGKRVNRICPYQPAGDVTIAFDGATADAFTRELDLEHAVARVSHSLSGGGIATTMTYAHANWPAIVIGLEADRQPFGADVALSRIDDAATMIKPYADSTQHGPVFGFTGTFDGENVAFDVRAVVRTQGGSATVHEDGSVRLDSVTKAVIVLTIHVDVDGDDPCPTAMRQLDLATQLWLVPDADPWQSLFDRHVTHWREHYDAVSLRIGTSPSRDLPTDRRVALIEQDASDSDAGLATLYFNYGRYLLLTSCLQATFPPHLQGKWNDMLDPPWDSDYHNDINLQMNYWPAEVCGLSWTTDSLFNLVEAMVPHGREMARNLYDCGGVFIPITTDRWARATPEAKGWDVWIGAAAWFAQHYWWHYEFTGDAAYLRDRAYPYMKEVAAFYEDYLVPDPRDQQRRLVPVPSQSPENNFKGGIAPVSLCVGAAMDLELADELLRHCIAAAQVLDVDGDKQSQWQDMVDRLMPVKIGRHGQLQEWNEDYEEAEPHHRHISHLYALFPGDAITLEDTPELAEAARVSLERRLAAGGGYTGWSRAWTVCVWTRLQEGDLAWEHLRALIHDHATTSLLDVHPMGSKPPVVQIEGNFGGCAGIAEMLMQSHRGVIRLLPALPSHWREGEVRGLRARGGFGVDVAWRDSRLASAVIVADRGGPCRVRFEGCENAGVICDGAAVDTRIEGSTLVFDASPGKRYAIQIAP